MYDWAGGAGSDDECIGVWAQEAANTGFTAGRRSQWMYACGHSAAHAGTGCGAGGGRLCAACCVLGRPVGALGSGRLAYHQAWHDPPRGARAAALH
ncbi:hypothetical protein ACFRLW_40210, partial [Streptomyces sp. NPDC056728]